MNFIAFTLSEVLTSSSALSAAFPMISDTRTCTVAAASSAFSAALVVICCTRSLTSGSSTGAMRSLGFIQIDFATLS